MKLYVAQTRPIRSDVSGNIINHQRLIDLALSDAANTIIFPELSLTGYEPELARALATDRDAARFDDFRRIADAGRITIVVGAGNNLIEPDRGGVGEQGCDVHVAADTRSPVPASPNQRQNQFSRGTYKLGTSGIFRDNVKHVTCKGSLYGKNAFLLHTNSTDNPPLSGAAYR